MDEIPNPPTSLCCFGGPVDIVRNWARLQGASAQQERVILAALDSNYLTKLPKSSPVETGCGNDDQIEGGDEHGDGSDDQGVATSKQTREKADYEHERWRAGREVTTTRTSRGDDDDQGESGDGDEQENNGDEQ